MRTPLYLAPIMAAVMILNAHAQTNDDDQDVGYKVVNGQVYIYDKESPTSLHLLPGVKPSEIAGKVDRPHPTHHAAPHGTTVVVPAAPRGAYGAPTRSHRTSNTALPSITFSEPAYSGSGVGYGTQKPANPIGGLPTYPGKQ